MSTTPIELTPDQRRAVTAVGSSVIVSASAGSGKTRVLAERLAYLVCDAPAPHRCDVDNLLVLTFTDAAAAEMRSRVVDALRRRAASGDPRLARQVALADAAQISTLHSFCLWMIRRWFTELDIDPSATVMDAEEAKLLRKDVLEGLFEKLYAFAAVPDDPLGKRDLDAPAQDPTPLNANAWHLGARSNEALSPDFNRLVDLYGLGEDAPIAALVLRLHEFTRSQTDPDTWLTACVTRLTPTSEDVLIETAANLVVELQRQAEYCDRRAVEIESGPMVGHFYAGKIRDYETNLRRWRADLGASPDPAAFERVRAAIDLFKFDPTRAPPLSKKTDTALIEQREPAQKTYSEKIKKKLFDDRLRPRFGRSSIAEMRDHLAATAGFVAAIVDLVARFDVEYAAAKRRLNVLDFNDLERFALQLLRQEDIAAALRRRFAHVLVDEFQDINPVQQEILRLVSRESDPNSPGNLFVVGDVKQSIYRFRLAEPALFTHRIERFRGDGPGQALFLQHNFRSRPEILDAVNHLFRRLMREDLGPTRYDELAELRAGKLDDPKRSRCPVELHVLEKKKQVSDDDTEEEPSTDDQEGSGAAEENPPRDWSAIEREAYLIATKIVELRAAAPKDAPLSYRDIAILLRTTKVNAERVAHILGMLGIPAFAEVGGSLFTAMEICDVVSALEVMDNLQQDIPLVGVLRGGFFGERFTEDELVDIRCIDHDVPFHQAVRLRANQDDTLAARLREVLDTIARYRNDARRRPLAEVLWRLYDETAYLAYAGGLPNGPQRRANLLKLHSLARQFGAFRRQGLHRFLRFIRSLADEEQDLAVAPALGESDDVVRIMSVHHAKGLEFPVVFVAGLGSKFNLRDRSGRMLFERSAHLGLRVIDFAKRIEFPSAAHRLVVDEINRTAREEEMRILYVAMTRAKERLFLIASSDESPPPVLPPLPRGGAGGGSPTAFEIATAQSPIDWLRAATDGDPTQTVFTTHAHTFAEMDAWKLDRAADARETAMRTAVSRGDPLPSDEPMSPDDPSVEEVLNRLTWVYLHAPATALPATLGAGEWARTAPPPLTRGAGRAQGGSVSGGSLRSSQFDLRSFLIPASKYVPITEPAIHRGQLTHRVLQHLDFQRATSPYALTLELQRLIDVGLLNADDRRWIDEPALAWFVTTPLAERIRATGTHFRREFRFLAAMTPPKLESACADDRMLVRGIVDGILDSVETLEVIDYKTDAIKEEQVEQRATDHRPTIDLYAQTVGRLWRKKVAKCSLVFLTPRRVVEWKP